MTKEGLILAIWDPRPSASCKPLDAPDRNTSPEVRVADAIKTAYSSQSVELGRQLSPLSYQIS